MVDSVIFYISAAKDLSYERDLLSRIATEVPVTLGWQIFLTPIKGELVNISAIQDADIHVLLLGKDIKAPIGYEWYRARSVGKRPLLFYKREVPHTPSADDFIRTLSSDSTWLNYVDLSGLRHQVLQHLGNLILSRAEVFALQPIEFDQLSSWLKDLEQTEPDQIDAIQGGAGESSIILSAERFIPKNGVQIQLTEDDQNKRCIDSSANRSD